MAWPSTTRKYCYSIKSCRHGPLNRAVPTWHGTAQPLSALPVGWKRETREVMLLPQSPELCSAAALPAGLSLRCRRHQPPPPMTAFTSLAALQQSLRLLSPLRGLHCGALFSHAPSPLPLPSPKRPSSIAVESLKQDEEEGDEGEAEWEDGGFMGLEARGKEKRRGRRTDEARSGIPERDDGQLLGSEAMGRRRGGDDELMKLDPGFRSGTTADSWVRRPWGRRRLKRRG